MAVPDMTKQLLSRSPKSLSSYRWILSRSKSSPENMEMIPKDLRNSQPKDMILKLSKIK